MIADKLKELYKAEPEKLDYFWHNYPYFDPNVLTSERHRYHFLEIVRDASGESLESRINKYLNIKFNPVGSYMPLEKNLSKFKALASEASSILENILERGVLDEDIKKHLRERSDISDTNDIFDLINLFSSCDDVRVKYEIMRKIGITFLLGRVKNVMTFQKAVEYHEYLDSLFRSELGITCGEDDFYSIYFWLDADNTLVTSTSREEALAIHSRNSAQRKERGLEVYPLQDASLCRMKSKNGNAVLKFITRIKHYRKGREDFTSVIEKIIRKNILYPTDINDLYGVTFVINDKEEFKHLVQEIESFLGGTNTRKAEKMIQKAAVSEYSKSEENRFRIWKAIYDITLSNEKINLIDREIEKERHDIDVMERALEKAEKYKSDDFLFLKEHVEGKKESVKRLLRERENCSSVPFDIYVEIQIQDLKSYLLSKCHGSMTEHSALKREQVRGNSLYKLFPREIYCREC